MPLLYNIGKMAGRILSPRGLDNKQAEVITEVPQKEFFGDILAARTGTQCVKSREVFEVYKDFLFLSHGPQVHVDDSFVLSFWGKTERAIPDLELEAWDIGIGHKKGSTLDRWKAFGGHKKESTISSVWNLLYNYEGLLSKHTINEFFVRDYREQVVAVRCTHLRGAWFLKVVGLEETHGMWSVGRVIRSHKLPQGNAVAV